MNKDLNLGGTTILSSLWMESFFIEKNKKRNNNELRRKCNVRKSE